MTLRGDRLLCLPLTPEEARLTATLEVVGVVPQETYTSIIARPAGAEPLTTSIPVFTPLQMMSTLPPGWLQGIYVL